MLYEKDNELKLSNKKVIFTERGEQKEKYIGLEGEQWWNELANKHGHINIIEIQTVEYTTEQLARHEEIRSLKGDIDELETYVIDGTISEVVPEEVNTITELKLRKENQELEGVVGDLTQLLIDKGVIY